MGETIPVPDGAEAAVQLGTSAQPKTSRIVGKPTFRKPTYRK
jgi:hypothetical protein